jgi:hypothetical protein
VLWVLLVLACCCLTVKGFSQGAAAACALPAAAITADVAVRLLLAIRFVLLLHSLLLWLLWPFYP